MTNDRSRIHLRATTEREMLLADAVDALEGDVAESAAIDAALRHLAESVENAQEVKDELTPQQAEKLSTSVVSINHYPQVNRKP